MRFLGAALILTATSGCSVIDHLAAMTDGPKLDPTKVYLGRSVVMDVTSREMGRYACANGPMLCQQRGNGFDCSCN